MFAVIVNADFVLLSTRLQHVIWLENDQMSIHQRQCLINCNNMILSTICWFAFFFSLSPLRCYYNWCRCYYLHAISHSNSVNRMNHGTYRDTWKKEKEKIIVRFKLKWSYGWLNEYWNTWWRYLSYIWSSWRVL